MEPVLTYLDITVHLILFADLILKIPAFHLFAEALEGLDYFFFHN